MTSKTELQTLKLYLFFVIFQVKTPCEKNFNRVTNSRFLKKMKLQSY